jgi:hypothetical protein
VCGRPVASPRWDRGQDTWPGWTAVMEIEKSQPRHFDDVLRDLLPERGHQAQVRLPVIDQQFMEFGRFHPAGEHGNIHGLGKPPDNRLILRRVRIFPKPDLGVAVGLRGVVRGDAYHLHLIGKLVEKQFAQDVVSTHETAKHHHSRPAFGIFS